MGPGGTAQDITHNDGGVMYLIILGTNTWDDKLLLLLLLLQLLLLLLQDMAHTEGEDKAHSNVW